MGMTVHKPKRTILENITNRPARIMGSKATLLKLKSDTIDVEHYKPLVDIDLQMVRYKDEKRKLTWKLILNKKSEVHLLGK